MKTVAVFCSADDKVSERYKTEAYQLGIDIAKAGHNLVTGGSKTGLMKQVVDGFLTTASPERVTGVLPKVLKEHNVHHEGITQLQWSDGMHERLKTFHELSQAIIVLPGGFGTLHELMDFLVSNQFGITSQKIILLNSGAFWDFLLKQFEVMQEENILAAKHMGLLQVATSIEKALSLLDSTKLEAGLGDKYWQANSAIQTTVSAVAPLGPLVESSASTTIPQQPVVSTIDGIDVVKLVGEFWQMQSRAKANSASHEK